MNRFPLLFGVGIVLALPIGSSRAEEASAAPTPVAKAVAAEAADQNDPKETSATPTTNLADWFDCCRRATIRAEALYLKPDEARTLRLANQVQPNARGILFRAALRANAPEEGFGVPRLTIEWPIDDRNLYEMTGFYMGGPERSGRSLSGFDNPFFLDANAADPLQRGFLTNLPANFPTQADRMLSDWDFQTWGVSLDRIGYRERLAWWPGALGMGVGLRYFGMIEDFDVRAIDEVNGRSGQLAVEVDNHMLGPEILVRGETVLAQGRLRGLAELRVGLLGTAATVRKRVLVGGAVTGTGSSVRGQLSPLVEGNFFLEVTTWRQLVVFGGYQVLYLAGVNRAPEQIHTNLAQFVGTGADLETLFLHGPRVGVRLDY